MAEKKEPQAEPQPAADPAAAQQQQVLLRLDERNMRASYANAFRTNVTPEEVMIDFGVNVVSGTPGQGRQPEMTFQLGERIILNPFTAKRLAIPAEMAEAAGIRDEAVFTGMLDYFEIWSPARYADMQSQEKRVVASALKSLE